MPVTNTEVGFRQKVLVLTTTFICTHGIQEKNKWKLSRVLAALNNHMYMGIMRSRAAISADCSYR